MRSFKSVGLPLIGVTALAFFSLNAASPVFAAAEPSDNSSNDVPAAPSATVAQTTAAPSPVAQSPAPAAQPSDAQPAQASNPSAVDQQPADAKSAVAAPDGTAEAAAKPAPPPPPTLFARINLKTQTMTVQANGKTIHTWKVSTGAPGYATPPGMFKPGWMSRMWYSRQYDDAPMPYSVFFNGGIAVHGTMNPGSLGRAASHGCVRLATSNAAVFFKLVSKHGLAQTRVIVTGPQPFSTAQHLAAKQSQSSRRQRQAQSAAWVYASSGNAAYRVNQRGQDMYGYGYGYGQQRRMTAVRAQSPYWSRY